MIPTKVTWRMAKITKPERRYDFHKGSGCTLQLMIYMGKGGRVKLYGEDGTFSGHDAKSLMGVDIAGEGVTESFYVI